MEKTWLKNYPAGVPAEINPNEIASLQALGGGGYVEIEELLPIDADSAGFSAPVTAYPADPVPFNHPTKIAILRIKRKS